MKDIRQAHVKEEERRKEAFVTKMVFSGGQRSVGNVVVIPKRS
jgi:hypothetical protein